jgi:hypothetical protein
VASQICPGIHIVPARDGGSGVSSGVGIMPGVHCQPAWHICPISQRSPGKHIADVGELGPDELPGGLVPGGIGGATTHPVSRSARGHTRIGLPRNIKLNQTPAKLNQR